MNVSANMFNLRLDILFLKMHSCVCLNRRYFRKKGYCIELSYLIYFSAKAIKLSLKYCFTQKQKSSPMLVWIVLMSLGIRGKGHLRKTQNPLCAKFIQKNLY